jgi:hypothetical protein
VNNPQQPREYDAVFEGLKPEQITVVTINSVVQIKNRVRTSRIAFPVWRLGTRDIFERIILGLI